MTSCPHNDPSRWTLPHLHADDHKYTRGHALILGGAVMTGAARLAALAAQRAGAGLVTILAPAEAWPIYATSMLSVITRPLVHGAWDAMMRDARVTTVLAGPGAGINDTLRESILAALEAKKKLVLDADAITLLARDASLRGRLADTILTPHEGEYRALASALRLDTAADKPTRAKALAERLGAVVLLKGADTCIAAPDGSCVHNDNGPAWLATGGTGDLLAGIITGLVAQGIPLFDAAYAGAWIHGAAAQAFGPGMIAEDLLIEIPATLQSIA